MQTTLESLTNNGEFRIRAGVHCLWQLHLARLAQTSCLLVVVDGFTSVLAQKSALASILQKVWDHRRDLPMQGVAPGKLRRKAGVRFSRAISSGSEFLILLQLNQLNRVNQLPIDTLVHL